MKRTRIGAQLPAAKRSPQDDPAKLLAALLAMDLRPARRADAAEARPAAGSDELLAALLREDLRSRQERRP